MQAVIYVRDTKAISVYSQFNQCAEYAKRYGYSIEYKVLDFDGTKFYQAMNKVIVNHDTSALIVHSKDVFKDNDEYLFYKIYCNKLGKKLITIV